MKKVFHMVVASFVLAFIEALCSSAHAQGAAFTYQGRLSDGTNQANGIYDLAFALFATNSGGSPLIGPVTNFNTAVSNGMFIATLDFGEGTFNGAARWLEISVRTNAAGNFTTLSPRQPVTPVPYATFATTAGSVNGSISDSQLSGNIARLNVTNAFSGVLLASNVSNVVAGNGGGLTNLNAANVSGLAFLSLATNFGVTGVGDETAKLQAALNAGRPVLVDISIYASNCYVTNYSYLKSDGHSIIRQTGTATGDLLFADRFASDFVLDGLLLDGGFYGDFNIPPWTFSNQVIYQQASYGAQRNGLHFCNYNAHSYVLNCKSRGFSAAAFIVDGFGLPGPQPTDTTTIISGCAAQNCWQGFLCQNSGEYINLENCSGQLCGRALDIESGNVTVTGGIFTRNGIGAFVIGGVLNPAHGLINGACFNHNEIGVVASDFNNGEMFNNCVFLGQGVYGGQNSIFMTNCSGVTFANCYVNSSMTIMADGGSGISAGPNFLVNSLALGYPTIITTNNGILLVTPGFMNLTGATTLTNTFNVNFPNAAFGSMTVSNAPTLQTTNAPPTGVTVGTTAPDRWFPVTNNGVTYLLPAWKNH